MHLLEVLAVIGGADMAPAALSLLYRDEQASADNGLDWTRAAGLFGEAGDHDAAFQQDRHRGGKSDLQGSGERDRAELPVVLPEAGREHLE